MIFSPVRGDSAGEVFVGQFFAGVEWRLRVVARNDKDALAVRRQSQRVRTVLAAATELFQLYAFVKLIIAVGIFGSIQPTAGTSVATEVQRIKRPQHTLSPRRLEFAFGEIESFDDGLGERLGVSPPCVFRCWLRV